MKTVEIGVFQHKGTTGILCEHYHGYVYWSGPKWENCTWHQRLITDDYSIHEAIQSCIWDHVIDKKKVRDLVL